MSQSHETLMQVCNLGKNIAEDLNKLTTEDKVDKEASAKRIKDMVRGTASKPDVVLK